MLFILSVGWGCFNDTQEGFFCQTLWTFIAHDLKIKTDSLATEIYSICHDSVSPPSVCLKNEWSFENGSLLPKDYFSTYSCLHWPYSIFLSFCTSNNFRLWAYLTSRYSNHIFLLVFSNFYFSIEICVMWMFRMCTLHMSVCLLPLF